MVSEHFDPRQQMVWSDWAGWYVPSKIPNPFRSLAADRPYSFSGYGGAPADRPYSFSGYGGAPVDRPYSFSGYGGAPADRPYFLSGYGGGPNRSVVKVPDIVPGKIPNPAPISGKAQSMAFDLTATRRRMMKPMVRYEEDATDPTAIWRIVLLRPSVEPRHIPDRVPPAELKNEKTRRVEDPRQINPSSTQGVHLHGTPEGNFNPPPTGFSAVPKGWGEDQLPHAFVASPTLNNLNPNSEPESARQCFQLNLTGVVEIPEGNSSGVVWEDNNVNCEDDNMSLDNESDQDDDFSDTEVRPSEADHVKDLAVLNVDAPTDHLTPINVGLSSALRVGQQCLTIRNPFGFDHTLTVGVISGLSRDIFSKAGVTIEDGAHFNMKQSAFLYNLEGQTLPKSHHYFFIRLTLEYCKFSSLDSYEFSACKFNNPKHRPYVILSKNITAAYIIYGAILMRQPAEFNPLQFNAVYCSEGYNSYAVVSFTKDWIGFKNTLAFQNYWKSKCLGKRDWNETNQQGKHSYGWLPKEEDDKSGGSVDRFLSEIGDHEEMDGLVSLVEGGANGDFTPKSDSQFDPAAFYEAIKPSIETGLLEEELPDPLPYLGPDPFRAANWKVQHEKGNAVVSSPSQENVQCAPYCVPIDFICKNSRMFYNPFSGNVSLQPEYSIVETEEKHICALCLELTEAAQTNMCNHVTLIVCPAPILAQWHSEITGHTMPGSLKFCIYEGERKAGCTFTQRTDMTEISTSDIVLTTYDVMKEDLSHNPDRHDDDWHFLRFQKRYPVIPTVLTRVHWWRLCLDEAQMVDPSKTSVTEMAMRLNTQHRWCITGTPIQHRRDDPKVRSKILSEEFGLDKDLAKKIWYFGPETTDPNMVVDMCKGVHYPYEIKDSVVVRFQWVSKEGALAEENRHGVCFEEPVYLVEVKTSENALDGIYCVLNQKRGFVQFCYEPIKQIFKTYMNDQKDKLWLMLQKRGVTMKTDEKEQKEKAQRYRVENLYEGPLEDIYAAAIRNCDPKGPLMLYVSRMIPASDKGRFCAFGCVLSEKIATSMKVRIMGSNYVPGQKKDWYVKNVQRTVNWMGKKQGSMEDAPYVNTVAMVGLDQFITKKETLINEKEVEACLIRAMKFTVFPVVYIAVLVLSCSVIMLNTDQRNVRVKKKMTEEDSIRNNNHINDGNDLPREFLSELYYSICRNEIRIIWGSQRGHHHILLVTPTISLITTCFLSWQDQQLLLYQWFLIMLSMKRFLRDVVMALCQWQSWLHSIILRMYGMTLWWHFVASMVMQLKIRIYQLFEAEILGECGATLSISVLMVEHIMNFTP